MPAGYRILPAIYDRWQNSYGKDYSTLILPRLLSSIEEFGIRRSTMVDIACGTGSLALMLARRGWTVFGVDASPGMLREARRRLEGRELPVRFFRQDMRELRLREPVMLATCLFDSLNHLLVPGDILRTFRAVCASLAPGGYFIFDVNNERCFSRLWTRTQTVHHSDFVLILANSYDGEKAIARSDVTLFLRKGRTYEMHNEIVRERCFAGSDLRVLLERAGFRVKRMEDFNFTNVPELGKMKTWCVAQRR